MNLLCKLRFKLSLYQRLSLLLLLVFTTIALVFYFWSSRVEQTYRYESQQQLHLSLAANLARDNPILQKGIYDHDALENLFHTLMVLGPAFEFYFLDPKGKILSYSGYSAEIKRKTIDIIPIISLTHNQQALPVYGDDPRHISRKKIFTAAPVFNGNSLQGYLYIIVTSKHYDKAYEKTEQSKNTQYSIWLVCSALLFLFIVTLGLFASITKPLRRLINEINNHPMVHDERYLSEKIIVPTVSHFDEALSYFGQEKTIKSEPAQHISLDSSKSETNNEVKHLGFVFERMMNKINLQMNLIKKTDEHRREMLADISHDLRTPLASLQGYIETLQLNHQKLNVEQRDKYISTSLKNAQQLKKLIDQIFELAHLENDKAAINIEQCNIIEFFYDICAKFKIKVADKNIELSINPQQGNIQVATDIGKLERVVSNLLENAIRHTPENGKITLEVDTHLKHSDDFSKIKHCLVSISDTGTGIKQEEIAYIFEARYRASNAIQDDESHNGLGLAITRKLLQLLDTDVKVASELNKGSCFSFKLTLL